MHKELNDLTVMLHTAALAPEDGKAPDVLVVPYADVPYSRDGINGVQRLNKEYAGKLIAFMTKLAESDPRLAAGLPMYIGHPDYTGPRQEKSLDFLREQPPSTGWMKSFTAGDDALLINMEWNSKGHSLVGGKEYLFFSLSLGSRKAGRTKDGKTIWQPVYIKSAGLTNTPNWPLAPMVNAGDGIDGAAIKESNTMDLLKRLQAILGDDKIKSDDDMVSVFTKVIDAARRFRDHLRDQWRIRNAVDEVLPNADAGELEALEATENLVNTLVETVNAESQTEDLLQDCRKRFATEMVNAAVEKGSVLKDHSESKVEDLLNAGAKFFEHIEELKGLPPLMKTEETVHTDTAAEREQQAADASGDPSAEAIGLVHARMDKDNLPYRTAFNCVQAERPELFGDQQSSED